MRDTVTLGSEHDRFREVSDWLQAVISDLSDRLGAVQGEARGVAGSWDGAAANPLLAALDRLDASGHGLIEAMRSIAETLRRIALDLAAQDHSAAMALFGS